MKKRLLFLGPPGAGKGTQANLISTKYKLLHLSTGDLLRAEVNAGSEYGKEAKTIMERGELVSDELVLAIVKKKLSSKNSAGWLLDGFPRNVSQAVALEILLKEINQPIQSVVVIEVSDSILLKRLLSRGRSDDNEEVIKHRLEIYRQKTSPLVEYYTKQGLVSIVQGDGDVEQIEKRILETIC